MKDKELRKLSKEFMIAFICILTFSKVCPYCNPKLHESQHKRTRGTK